MRGTALSLAAFLLAATALAGGAAAQVDPGAPEGATQTAHAVRDFDSYDLPIGPFGIGDRAVRPVRGAVSWSAWRLDAPQASVAGVIEGYRGRLGALGFQPLFDCAGEACGGFDFRFGAEILPPPGMLVDVRDFAQLSLERDEPEGFVSVLASRVLDTLYVQTVSVTPPAADAAAPANSAAPADPAAEPAAEPAADPAAEPASQPAAEPVIDPAAEPAAEPEAPVEIIEVPSVETAPATVLLPQDEQALLARLREEGHVPVHGLAFEVGGAGLSDSSAEALDMLARILNQDAQLAVAIVGHSDNQGGLALNLDLSQRRAEAVMQALIDRGVPPGRVEARGIAYLAPVASNATEEGRARNRRVELVLR